MRAKGWVRAASGALAAMVVAVAVAVPPASASAPVTASDTVGADGDVLAFAHHGDRVWAGGRFSHVAELVHSGAVVAEDDGQRVANLSRVRLGPVVTAVKDLAGGWLIGGAFTEVAGSQRRGVARILSTGWTSSWNPDVAGTVNAIAHDGTTVYLGGEFTAVGGQARSNLAAVDFKTGAVRPWNPGSDGPVLALELSGSVLFVGGDFTSVGAAPRANLAAVDAAGVVAPWVADTDASVEDLLAANGKLYVGGDFASIGGATRSHAAALDLATAGVLAWAPETDGPVVALVARADGTTVFVGGSFATVAGVARANLAEVAASTGVPTAFDPGTNGPVLDIDLSRWRPDQPADAVLYAVGDFSTAGGLERLRGAGVDTRTGAVGPWNPSTDGPVNTVARSGTAVYVGGAFERLNGAPRAALSALDAATGDLDHGFEAGVDGEIYTVAASPDGTVVYAGGAFATANGVARRNLAAFDGTTGELLAWNPNPDGVIKSIAASATRAYVGGGFNTIGGRTRPGLASIDATTGLTDVRFDAFASGVSRVALSTDGTRVYVGGWFKRMAKQNRPGFAELDAVTGASTSFSPTSGGAIVDMTVAPSGGRVWISTSSNRLYAYDPSLADQPAWTVQTSGDIQGMAASATDLYIGGHFSSIKGQASRLHAASLSVEDGVVTAWDPVVGGIYGPWAMAVVPSGVVMGGDFDKVGTQWHPRLAIFNGTP